MDIGKKLKSLREYHGFSQADIAKALNTTQRNISYYEAMEGPTGVLDYIVRFCDIVRMSPAEFFMEDMSTVSKELPAYITPHNAAMLKILNTQIDIKTRIKVEEAFVSILEAIVIQYGDRLKHMKEYVELFGDKGESENS